MSDNRYPLNRDFEDGLNASTKADDDVSPTAVEDCVNDLLEIKEEYDEGTFAIALFAVENEHHEGALW